MHAGIEKRCQDKMGQPYRSYHKTKGKIIVPDLTALGKFTGDGLPTGALAAMPK